ncbi:hypothetical protein F1188_12940 [Roseospira marina]|uniref:Uncharacterized protein n=1 Tax=Roseospira marina TaxID=140057 RepID=A0A5M6IC25_9PROT|nr:hypothetical protein [Roseospira marina]KAA5605178.1 hypothetical protein F1188_12940 [Roseospira marina]MBB4314936.1 hypothetical protein [Roseospira marina]MBB5087936.1 hypothetical protein [Roseospira marina]
MEEFSIGQQFVVDRLTASTEGLVRAVAHLRQAATGKAADEDIEVIVRRLADAETILAAMNGSAQGDHTAPRPDAEHRQSLRHDLMNALGAIDNYAELIADHDATLSEPANAVRTATHDVVQAVRETGANAPK